MTWRSAVDDMLELSVVGSFTRVGPAVRRRLWGWTPPAAHRLDGRVVVVTGGSSGLGRATAEGAARLGASVVLLVRDVARGRSVAAQIGAASGADVAVVHADMGDLPSVRRAGEELSRHARIDVLVHNAGSLSGEARRTAQGIEETLATHVVGPLLLTHLCMPALTAAAPSRVIAVTSGGMYLQPLDVDALLSPPAGDSGTARYARAKRAQVALVQQCAGPLALRGVHLMAMHPGWADTPGLRRALPRFRTVVRPLLRSPAEGADTLVWLASAPLSEVGAGVLWLDRRARPVHRLRRTRRSDSVAARRRLLMECRRLAGLDDAGDSR